ncbi:MAG: DUF4332 domain-containing protein [Chloroflexi bacterium]|nr:DUF4332 domain-containing protein [Chloroflexota bacterium]
MTKLETIEGIGPVYAGKLREAGIATLEELLEAGASPEGRRELSQKTGIGNEYVLDWVNRADLMRIKGVGEEYSDLLEWAGIDTVVELAQRNPDNLFAKLQEVNLQRRLVRRIPAQTEVVRWIEQARSLPRVVNY